MGTHKLQRSFAPVHDTGENEVGAARSPVVFLAEVAGGVVHLLASPVLSSLKVKRAEPPKQLCAMVVGSDSRCSRVVVSPCGCVLAGAEGYFPPEHVLSAHVNLLSLKIQRAHCQHVIFCHGGMPTEKTG